LTYAGHQHYNYNLGRETHLELERFAFEEQTQIRIQAQHGMIRHLIQAFLKRGPSRLDKLILETTYQAISHDSSFPFDNSTYQTTAYPEPAERLLRDYSSPPSQQATRTD
jgi:hypothetical protein